LVRSGDGIQLYDGGQGLIREASKEGQGQELTVLIGLPNAFCRTRQPAQTLSWHGQVERR
jgi:hypothetical protein